VCHSPQLVAVFASSFVSFAVAWIFCTAAYVSFLRLRARLWEMPITLSLYFSSSLVGIASALKTKLVYELIFFSYYNVKLKQMCLYLVSN
jgi:hypothetical protein